MQSTFQPSDFVLFCRLVFWGSPTQEIYGHRVSPGLPKKRCEKGIKCARVLLGEMPMKEIE